MKTSLISRRLLALAAFATLGLGAGITAATAQAWPTAKPIVLLNPFPAGGGTDAFARPLAAALDAILNQRVLVDNRGGAGGTLGATQAAKMAPDGYTWFVGATHHTIAPSIYPKLEYDLQKDFIPVAVLGMPPQVISISKKSETLKDIKTLADFIKYAKANPGKVNYASSGNGTTHHLAAELFKILAGVDLVHVPYRGAGPAMQDLVAGKVDVMFDGAATSAKQIVGGNLTGLAVASKDRNPAMPDVPTAEQAGLKGYEVSTWYALFAIKGTPPDVIAKMQDAVKKALATENVKKVWAGNASAVPSIYGADFAKLVDTEIKTWAKVVKEAKVGIK